METRREQKNAPLSLHHWCESRNVHSCSLPPPPLYVCAQHPGVTLQCGPVKLKQGSWPPRLIYTPIKRRLCRCLASSRVNTTLVEGLPFSRCFKGMSCTAWTGDQCPQQRHPHPQLLSIYIAVKYRSRSLVTLWVPEVLPPAAASLHFFSGSSGCL